MTKGSVSNIGIRVKKALEEGYIIVKIDRHEAKRTGAFTRWIIPNDTELIYINFGYGKTHWDEYYLTKPNSVWIRIRRSNRGNLSTLKLTGEQLRISDDELNNIITILEKT